MKGELGKRSSLPLLHLDQKIPMKEKECVKEKIHLYIKALEYRSIRAFKNNYPFANCTLYLPFSLFFTAIRNLSRTVRGLQLVNLVSSVN